MRNRFEITFKRGHGPGGQHKNKVETCVVVIDPKTGFTETCQDTPSQFKNKKIAISRLERRILVYENNIKQYVQNERRKEQIGRHAVMRTYNFARNEVKDHRTGKKANLKKVLEGNIELLN